MNSINNYKNKIIHIIFFILLGYILRVLVSYIGWNFDFESYKIVGKIVVNGGNVYNETTRYNYAPLFFLFQGLLFKISLAFNNNEFIYRILILTILSFVDIIIFIILLRKFDFKTALIFYLNPISIIITGFHNQFDNIAILFGLLAIIKINYCEKFSFNDIPILIFLTLSLCTKHINAFFQIWILFNNKLPIFKRRLYTYFPILLFSLSFLPFWYEGKIGIINNVFLYKSFNNLPLVTPLIELFSIIFNLNLSSLTNFYTLIFLICMIITGFIFRNINIIENYLLYLMCLVTFSSAIANQYLVIPLISIIIINVKLSYLYTIIITFYLIIDKNGLHLLDLYNDIITSNNTYVEYFIKYSYSIATIILLTTILIYYRKSNKLLFNNTLYNQEQR